VQLYGSAAAALQTIVLKMFSGFELKGMSSRIESAQVKQRLA
jgi:hypothetical protein